MSQSEQPELQALIDFLRAASEGIVRDTAELEHRLALAWDHFECNHEGGMRAYKLRGRIERVEWAPPFLSFVIERHGGRAMGSSRAELQGWLLNIDTATAQYRSGGHRQIHPMQARLDVKPLADDLVNAILAGTPDSRLKWYPDGSVRVIPGGVIPDDGPKATIGGRRKRFRLATEERLASHGWVKAATNKYRPPVKR